MCLFVYERICIVPLSIMVKARNKLDDINDGLVFKK